jgi:hypothetical protein
VVKELSYKPEGGLFESRWGEMLNLPNPEMSTGNIKKKLFLGNEVRLVRWADNLTAIYEPIV